MLRQVFIMVYLHFLNSESFSFPVVRTGADTTGSSVLLRRAESLMRGFAAALTGSVTGNAAPSMEPQTAHPATQSSQWLSWDCGLSFHSSTVRPRPCVFTRYSAVRCSASN